MSTVIRVENISKRYRLGQTHGGSFANRIQRAAGKMFGRRAPRAALKVSAASSPSQVDDHGDFWALRDVSLSVEAGEVVGLIGRNGAGKSTLLKILSRIVTPTAGRAELRGRVASLLEVGTGFHPELTGRENVFLNGAILGMTKAEIRDRFQEIVDFSEIGTFIDTPVKRYSSGMYVRLAFAVAAHIDPEILIVDEVLAVGDLEFQRKCLGKIADISGSGRTVLFVSHNVGAVRRLCTRCVVLDSGAVAIDGTTAAALERYLAKGAACNGVATWDQGISNPGIDDFRFLGVRLLDEMGQPSGHLSSNGNFNLEIQYCTDRDVQDCRVGFQINAADGTPVCELYDTDVLSRAPVRRAGRKTLSCTFRCPELANGRYVISLNAGIPFTRNLAYVEGAIAFEVANSNNGGFMSQLPRSGLICPIAEWRAQEVA